MLEGKQAYSWLIGFAKIWKKDCEEHQKLGMPFQYTFEQLTKK